MRDHGAWNRRTSGSAAQGRAAASHPRGPSVPQFAAQCGLGPGRVGVTSEVSLEALGLRPPSGRRTPAALRHS